VATYMMRVAAIVCAGHQACRFILRRSIHDDLLEPFEGPNGFHMLMAPWCLLLAGEDQADDEVRFRNGSKIYLRHCQHDSTASNIRARNA